MSTAITEAQETSAVAEQALRALWMFDVTAFGSCRCACCGGLRQTGEGDSQSPVILSVMEPAAESSPA